jgi:hypothetical protein
MRGWGPRQRGGRPCLTHPVGGHLPEHGHLSGRGREQRDEAGGLGGHLSERRSGPVVAGRRLEGLSVSRSVSRSVSQSVGQLVGRSVSRSVGWSVNQSGRQAEKREGHTAQGAHPDPNLIN